MTWLFDFDSPSSPPPCSLTNLCLRCRKRYFIGQCTTYLDKVLHAQYNTLNIPDEEKIEGIEEKVPFYLLGDEIFPIGALAHAVTTSHWLMRPYPGDQSEAEQIYNYPHSSCRLPIGNAFGILVARWRIFQKPIMAKLDNIHFYIMACLCLHNYLRQAENSLYCPYEFVAVVKSRKGNGGKLLSIVEHLPGLINL